MQARFIELATEAHPRNPNGGDNNRYEELKSGFTVLFIGKLREAYNSGGIDAVNSKEGHSKGVFAWMSRSANNGDLPSEATLGAVEAPEGAIREPEQLSDVEKQALKDFRTANAAYFAPWVDEVGVSSIIEFVENKF